MDVKVKIIGPKRYPYEARISDEIYTRNTKKPCSSFFNFLVNLDIDHLCDLIGIDTVKNGLWVEVWIGEDGDPDQDYSLWTRQERFDMEDPKSGYVSSYRLSTRPIRVTTPKSLKSFRVRKDKKPFYGVWWYRDINDITGSMFDKLTEIKWTENGVDLHVNGGHVVMSIVNQLNQNLVTGKDVMGNEFTYHALWYIPEFGYYTGSIHTDTVEKYLEPINKSSTPVLKPDAMKKVMKTGIKPTTTPNIWGNFTKGENHDE